MSWEIIFVCFLIIAALTSFILEKIPVDLTAMVLFATIITVSVISGSPYLPSASEIVGVFSNPAPLTIIAMFIISASLERCGVIEFLADGLSKFIKLGYTGILTLLLLLTAVVSAFINNTAVVVVLLPVVLNVARKMKTPASKFLIPLSYASIFGGCCTLIGTSTNILVSGVLETHNMEPLGMFELSSIGGPLLIVGILFLVTFGKKLLPVRETLMSILSDEERKEYIIEAFVNRGSQLIGVSLKESGLLKTSGMRVLEIVRNSVALEGEFEHVILEEGDRLVLGCHPSAIMKARQLEGVNFADQMGLGVEQIAAHEGAIVEAVVGPNSSLVGKTIREINFRQRYRMVLLAVHRRGANLREKLGILRFEFGDTLLLMGTEIAIEKLRRGDDLILLDKPMIPAQDMRRKIPLALGILLGVIVCISFELMPIVAAGLVGATLIFVTGCLRLKDGYNAIEWRILVLIYGMLALGLCMETTGFTKLIVENLVNLGGAYLSPELRPHFMLGAIFLLGSLLTEVLTNNAVAVLMTPIAIGLGVTMGVDPRPYVIATAIASSASFCTPIGYQTNTYVYAVGGYHFSDFLKVGIGMNLLYFLGSIFIIPIFWPF